MLDSIYHDTKSTFKSPFLHAKNATHKKAQDLAYIGDIVITIII